MESKVCSHFSAISLWKSQAWALNSWGKMPSFNFSHCSHEVQFFYSPVNQLLEDGPGTLSRGDLTINCLKTRQRIQETPSSAIPLENISSIIREEVGWCCKELVNGRTYEKSGAHGETIHIISPSPRGPQTLDLEESAIKLERCYKCSMPWSLPRGRGLDTNRW